MPDPGQRELREGDRVRVTSEPQHAGKEGTVHEVRLWGRYPISVAFDGHPGVYGFSERELARI
jgi:acyl-coenzyme A thioesterase PaaI-like protein